MAQPNTPSPQEQEKPATGSENPSPKDQTPKSNSLGALMDKIRNDPSIRSQVATSQTQSPPDPGKPNPDPSQPSPETSSEPNSTQSQPTNSNDNNQPPKEGEEKAEGDEEAAKKKVVTFDDAFNQEEPPGEEEPIEEPKKATDWKSAKEASYQRGIDKARDESKAEISRLVDENKRLAAIVEQTNFRQSPRFNDEISAPRERLAASLDQIKGVDGVADVAAMIRSNSLNMHNVPELEGLSGFQQQFYASTIMNAIDLSAREAEMIEDYQQNPDASKATNAAYEQKIQAQVIQSQAQNLESQIAMVHKFAREHISDYRDEDFAVVAEHFSAGVDPNKSVAYLAKQAVAGPYKDRVIAEMTERIEELEKDKADLADHVSKMSGSPGSTQGASSGSAGGSPFAAKMAEFTKKAQSSLTN